MWLFLQSPLCHVHPAVRILPMPFLSCAHLQMLKFGIRLSLVPSVACEAASNCEQHPAGLLGSNRDWDRSRVLCPQTRICAPCWLCLEVIPKAGFGIALFISLVVFSLKTSLWHFVESQNDLSWRYRKAPSIAPAMAGTHSSGPGIGIATIIP